MRKQKNTQPQEQPTQTAQPEPQEREKGQPKPVDDKARAALKAKHTHVDETTLQNDETQAGFWKRSVVAHLECGHDERLYTSDLFQVKMCKRCKAEAKHAVRAAWQAKLDAIKQEAKERKAAKKEAKRLEREARKLEAQPMAKAA